MSEQQSKPTWSSVVFHVNSGCDIRHKTNEALNRCEDKIVDKIAKASK